MDILSSEYFYLCFTIGTDRASACARYVERYGQPPEQITESNGVLYLGPVSHNQIQADVPLTLDN